jgi:ferredoxin
MPTYDNAPTGTPLPVHISHPDGTMQTIMVPKDSAYIMDIALEEKVKFSKICNDYTCGGCSCTLRAGRYTGSRGEDNYHTLLERHEDGKILLCRHKVKDESMFTLFN